MPEASLVNLGELAKPATTLIEKISDAVGTLFEPVQIKRIAKAEAAATIIRTENEIQVQQRQQRAITRFVKEEEKKQINMENITQKALPNLEDDSKPEDVDDDWIANFFDKCRIISNDEMQGLWSRVLSGEANRPGAFSKRTVNLLSSIDKEDATIFSNLCNFGLTLNGLTPLIYDENNSIYNQHGVDFSSLSHLESIGLIKFNQLSGFDLSGLPKNIVLQYCKQNIELEFPNDTNNKLHLGKVMLTKIGYELAQINIISPDYKFLNYIYEYWKAKGLIKKEFTWESTVSDTNHGTEPI